jgi:hypothetical protein
VEDNWHSFSLLLINLPGKYLGIVGGLLQPSGETLSYTKLSRKIQPQEVSPMPRFLITVMVLALLLVGRNSLSRAAELPTSGQGRSYQNVPHVSGGISEEDRERLKQGGGLRGTMD